MGDQIRHERGTEEGGRGGAGGGVGSCNCVALIEGFTDYVPLGHKTETVKSGKQFGDGQQTGRSNNKNMRGRRGTPRMGRCRTPWLCKRKRRTLPKKCMDTKGQTSKYTYIKTNAPCHVAISAAKVVPPSSCGPNKGCCSLMYLANHETTVLTKASSKYTRQNKKTGRKCFSTESSSFNNRIAVVP